MFLVQKNSLTNTANLVFIWRSLKLSPNNFKDKNFLKYQFGGGLEYLAGNNLSLRLNAQYDMGFDDTWDNFVNGKRKDQAFHIGLGINYYIKQAKKHNIKN